MIKFDGGAKGTDIAIKKPDGIGNFEGMILTVFVSVMFHSILSMFEFVLEDRKEILKSFQMIIDGGIVGMWREAVFHTGMKTEIGKER